MNWTWILVLLVPLVVMGVFALALCRAAAQADAALNVAFKELRKRKTLLMLLILLGFGRAAHAQLPDAPQPQPDYLQNKTITFEPPRTPQTSRHPRRLIALLAANAFAVVGDQKDIRTSEELFRQYGYIESNTFLVGKHPTPGAYYKQEVFELSLLNVPSVLGYIFRKPELYFGGLAGPTMFGIIHLKQGFDNDAVIRRLQ